MAARGAISRLATGRASAAAAAASEAFPRAFQLGGISSVGNEIAFLSRVREVQRVPLGNAGGVLWLARPASTLVSTLNIVERGLSCECVEDPGRHQARDQMLGRRRFMLGATVAATMAGASLLLEHSQTQCEASTSSEASNKKAHSQCSECLSRHAIADAVEKAAPAVVNLTVSIGRGLFSGESMGSGSIIRPDGLILTNAHVVAELVDSSRQAQMAGPGGGGSAKGSPRLAAGPRHGTGAKLAVSLLDGRTFEGELVGYDIPTDLALVRVVQHPPHGPHNGSNQRISGGPAAGATAAPSPLPPLPVVKCGASKPLRPGDWVVALGSPLRLHNSVTVGVVSSVDRKSAELGLQGGRTDFIQTDAAINEGNSGGPLLNLDGELVGINSMKALGADGISFAVPIDTAQHVIEQLERHGRVIRPFVGLKMLELQPALIEQLKQRDPRFPDVSHGVLIPQVIPGSPADRAGIRAGDILVSLNNEPISTSRQVVDILGDHVGVTFEAVVKREGNVSATIKITTEEANPVF